MACQILRKHPIQLDFTFPENGCRSDFNLYYHPVAGPQRSILSCDWIENKNTYDCERRESGVTWIRPDSKHAIITLPQNFEHISGNFWYQISCYDRRKENTCLWSPEDEDYTTPVDALSSTTAMRTECSVQEDSNQFGSQAMIIGVSAAFIVMFTLILMLIIATFLLYKKYKKLTELKLGKTSYMALMPSEYTPEDLRGLGHSNIDYRTCQNPLTRTKLHEENKTIEKTDNKISAESLIEGGEPNAAYSMNLESNATFHTEFENMGTRASELATAEETKVENQPLESDNGKQIPIYRENESGEESDIEVEPSVSLLEKTGSHDVMENHIKTIPQKPKNLSAHTRTKAKNPLQERDWVLIDVR